MRLNVNYAARLVRRCRAVFFIATTLPPLRWRLLALVRRDVVRDPREEREEGRVELERAFVFAEPRAVVLRRRPRVVAAPRRVERRDFEPRTREVVARREPVGLERLVRLLPRSPSLRVFRERLPDSLRERVERPRAVVERPREVAERLRLLVDLVREPREA